MLSLRSMVSLFALSFASFGLVGCSGATDDDLASDDGALTRTVVADKLSAAGVHGGLLAYQAQNGTDRGYAIPSPYATCAPSPFAYKYISSAEMLQVNPAESPFVLLESGSTGFPRFRAALAAAGRSLSDVSFQFGAMTLRETEFPRAQVDASPNRTEVRHYAGSFVRIRLREADGYFRDLLRAKAGELELGVSYNDPQRCDDDVIRGEIAVSSLEPYRWGYASVGAQRVAEALIEDLWNSESVVTTASAAQTASGAARSAASIQARPSSQTSKRLEAPRVMVFSFKSTTSSLRMSEVRHGHFIGSRFNAGQGSVEAN